MYNRCKISVTISGATNSKLTVNFYKIKKCSTVYAQTIWGRFLSEGWLRSSKIVWVSWPTPFESCLVHPPLYLIISRIKNQRRIARIFFVLRKLALFQTHSPTCLWFLLMSSQVFKWKACRMRERGRKHKEELEDAKQRGGYIWNNILTNKSI